MFCLSIKAFDYHSSIFKLFLQKLNNPKSLEVSKSKGLNQDVSNRLWLNKSEGEWTNNDVQNTTQKIKD
jgi:hypothetical protein